jgi:hypothetical protein
MRSALFSSVATASDVSPDYDRYDVTVDLAAKIAEIERMKRMFEAEDTRARDEERAYWAEKEAAARQRNQEHEEASVGCTSRGGRGPGRLGSTQDRVSRVTGAGGAGRVGGAREGGGGGGGAIVEAPVEAPATAEGVAARARLVAMGICDPSDFATDEPSVVSMESAKGVVSMGGGGDVGGSAGGGAGGGVGRAARARARFNAVAAPPPVDGYAVVDSRFSTANAGYDPRAKAQHQFNEVEAVASPEPVSVHAVDGGVSTIAPLVTAPSSRMSPPACSKVAARAARAADLDEAVADMVARAGGGVVGGGLVLQNARRAHTMINQGESLLDMGVGVRVGQARLEQGRVERCVEQSHVERRIRRCVRALPKSPNQRMAQYGTGGAFADAVSVGGAGGNSAGGNGSIGPAAAPTAAPTAAEVIELCQGTRFLVKAGGQCQPHSIWLSRDQAKLQWRVCEQRQLGGAGSGGSNKPDGAVFISDIQTVRLKTSRYGTMQHAACTYTCCCIFCCTRCISPLLPHQEDRQVRAVSCYAHPLDAA